MPADEQDHDRPQHERAPVLDYEQPGSNEQRSPVHPLAIVLGLEVALLCMGLIALDGGMILKAVSIAFLVYWLINGLKMRKEKGLLSVTDRICLGLGVVFAVVAPFVR